MGLTPPVILFGDHLYTATARKGRAVYDDFVLPGVGNISTTSPTSYSPQLTPRMNRRVSQDAVLGRDLLESHLFQNRI
jgi:hypothetical protein